jgi:integrase
MGVVMFGLLKAMRAFTRRWYWNRQFLKNQQACLDSVMRDFASFLRVAHEPSSLARLQQTAPSPYGSAGRQRDALGPVTVEGYLKMIGKFVRDTGEIFPCKKSIADAIMRFHEGGRSYSHIRNFRIAAEWYMEFWGDPINLPHARKPARVIREFLEEAEVRAILKACKTSRETAIVATLAYSGLRIRELSCLAVSDIGWHDKSLLVREGKGLKDRIVCVSQACIDILRAYVQDKKKSRRIPFLQAHPAYCGGL